jgi:tetratricopeptide (TPR) repeat protein
MRRAWVVLALWVAACRGGPAPGGGAASPGALSGPVAEAKALLEQGQPDAALARLEAAGNDPDALYYQGLAWAKKAQTAPLPTPPPVASPQPKGVPAAPAPEFKTEELNAIARLEAAVQAQPGHAAAQLALGDLLAPHALRRYQRLKEAANRKGKPEAVVLPESPVDVSLERVERAYRAAVQADTVSPVPVEKMIAFDVGADRLAAAEEGFHELLNRVRERAQPFVQYGDFLAQVKKDQDRAIEQYRQALIWEPHNEDASRKLAEIYLSRGIAFFEQQQYASAEAQLTEAKKYVADRNSELGQRLARYTDRLREIRQPSVK